MNKFVMQLINNCINLIQIPYNPLNIVMIDAFITYKSMQLASTTSVLMYEG